MQIAFTIAVVWLLVATGLLRMIRVGEGPIEDDEERAALVAIVIAWPITIAVVVICALIAAVDPAPFVGRRQ